MVTRRQLVAALALAAAAARTRAAAAGPEVLTVAEVHPGDYPTVTALNSINAELQSEFGGELILRVYHSGTLGSEKDTIDLARIGALAVTRVHSSVLNNAVPATRILSLPYVFESTEHMRRAFDGALGAEILAACAERDLVGLALYDSGSRNFYNARRAVRTPEDLKGLKLRVPQSDIFMQSVAALGASPTPLSYSAVFSSLQTRLVDGAENNWPSFHSSRHFEIARHWSQSEHAFAPDMLVMSQRAADALPREQRDFLVDAARRSVAVMRGEWDRRVAASRQAVVDAGVEVSEIDKSAFRRSVQPLLDRYLRDPAIRRLYDLLQRA
jgi:tripartite ATP-independent transporter DctP family solute receptor